MTDVFVNKILSSRETVRAFQKSLVDKRKQLEELADFFQFDLAALPDKSKVPKITRARAVNLLFKEKIRVIDFKQVGGSVAAFEVVGASDFDPFGSFRNVGFYNGQFFEMDAFSAIPAIKSEFLGRKSTNVCLLIVAI